MTDNVSKPVLEVSHLSTSFFTKAGEVKAVEMSVLRFTRARGLGLVGESGSARP
ncbi:MAG: hypothetical protein CM1200mP20_04670 [Pseudomonadota bacterium]|nr:MAG: hypothetical protein CM1200mP20_04670 [Pseudomonadota bacterium]